MNNTLIDVFKDLHDPRVGNGILHKLDEILTIAVMAAICECTQFTEMELFGKENEDWLRTFLELKNGIPSHDTFGDVFAILTPEAVEKCFMEWVEGIREKIPGELIAIDGKTIRGSKDMAKNKKAIHIVSAWAASNRIVLGGVATDEKSNEITAIPELLQMLCIKGCIVTIDAMGTQKDIAEVIIDQGADYVLPVKENHPTLHNDIELFFIFEDDFDSTKTVEKSHGRYEVRECSVSTDVDWLPGREDWKGLSGIGKIVSHREILSTGKTEKSVQSFRKVSQQLKKATFAQLDVVILSD
jgi:predicted transposase YbfD/YdcC